MRCGRDAESNRNGSREALYQDNRAAPARDVHSRPARSRTRTSEVGARRAAVYTTALKRTTRVERASPGGAPVLFRLSYVRA